MCRTLHKYFLFFIGCLITTNTYALTSNQLCQAFKTQNLKIQKNLPIEIDYLTTLIGIQVLDMGTYCHLNYNHVINTEKFIKTLATTDDIPTATIINFLKSKEGIKTLQDEMLTTGQERFSEFLKYKNIKITLHYAYDTNQLPSVHVTPIDTTK